MPPSKSTSTGIDPEVIRELANILRETDLSEIEVDVQNGELKLRIARQAAQQIVTVQQAAPNQTYAQPQTSAPQAVASAPAPVAVPAAPAASDRTNQAMVPSPIVGTAYLSPEPGAAAFINVGDKVTEGQTIMIIEAMKTMNPIPAPRSGTVTKICVADAQPVEYGEPLLILE